MTRRDFLTRSAAALAAAATLPHPTPAASAPPSGVPAIDTHTHFYDPTRPQGVPWPPKTDALLYRPHLPPDFQRATAGTPVLGTVVVEASEWVEDNQWVLDLAPRHPAIVGVVGNLRPGQPAFAGDLRRFAANPLFRGLRFRASDVQKSGQPDLRADVRRLADADLSLDVVGNSAILAPTLQLAKAYPSLRIVIDHLPFREWDGKPADLRHALREIAAQPNVAAKISDVVRRSGDTPIDDPAHYQPALDALVDLFGPDRILYGSNWAVSERVAPYAVVHRVVAAYFGSRGRELAEKYFWRNSRTFYRWVARGPAAALPVSAP
ncbi:MAG: amidohydrolase family protein [Opitutaceae bacterium]|nr:amidohydrolase family protein [Opitutaceae bacterium]